MFRAPDEPSGEVPAPAAAGQWEEELDASGALTPTAVVLLRNKRCPFRCVMCDLWRHMVDETVPPGAIPQQICDALAALPPARQIKLYNAGSFFDPGAIPPQDDAAIAAAVTQFDRVIVEAHPAFLAGAHGERCLRFRDRLRGRLEVAIGLETAHPGVLARLDKHMTLESFRAAASFLAAHDIALRVFILLQPPFLARDQAVEWACRSVDVARDAGATACSIIPTRPGNDAMPADFAPPRLRSLEQAMEWALSTSASSAAAAPRVFADLWDVERFYDCDCSPARATRLAAMNRTQHVPAALSCHCDG